MSCEQRERQILDYLEGELEKEEGEEIMQHVSQCRICAEALKRYQNQERMLDTYYERILKSALGAPKPKVEARRVAAPSFRLTYHLYAVAAILAFILLSGASLFVYHYITRSRSGNIVGIAARVMGRVQYFEGSILMPLKEGMPITSQTRLKTTNNSYLAVELKKAEQGKESNVVEFKENSLAVFHDFDKRTELALERGEVWVHLNQKPDKEFSVRVRNGVVHDQGTIFNVAQGMTGMTVGVVTGEVALEQQGTSSLVKKRQFYSSSEKDTKDNVRNHVYWSHYKEKLLALLGPEKEERTLAGAATQLRVREYQKAENALSIPVEEESLGALDPVELLPVDTLLFFEMASMPDSIREWNSSDYSRLFRDSAVIEWWESEPMKDVRTKFNDNLGINAWLTLARSVNGGMCLSVNSKGNVIIIADCRKDPLSVKKILEESIYPFLKKSKDLHGQEGIIPQVEMSRGYFVMGWGASLFDSTKKSILEDKPTGFTQSRFYQNLRSNVPQSRMTIAYDFQSTMRKLESKGDANLNKFLARSGFDGLDYVLGSPDFSGRGINQAFRVAFMDKRHGIMGWLDEPAPMGSLRYFAPDVHFLMAARIKNPEIMLSDVLGWMNEDMGVTMDMEGEKIISWLRDFAACLGNEVAVGLQNPVLPIPNIQIAVELVDPMKFHDMMLEWIEIMDKNSPIKLTVEAKEYREKLIVTIVVPGKPFNVSYVVLDDFVLFGPGEPFLRHAVDIFMENHSIVDEYAFQKLLPSSGQLNFSFFNYYNLSQTIPQIVGDFSKRNLSPREQAILPKLDIVERFQSAGIGYAYSSDQYIDFYINGSTGVDFNFGGALPFIASLLTSKLFADDFDSQFVNASNNLQTTATALEAFYVDNSRYPETLDHLLSPIQYLASTPRDPFSKDGQEPLVFTLLDEGKAYSIYSMGPDRVDNLGLVSYDPTNGTVSAGDMVRKGGTALVNP